LKMRKSRTSCKSLWFVASIVILSCTTSCGHANVAAKRQFCAVMTDSVGLYVGNPVTQMGYKIGSVTSIEPRDTDVTVKFTIDSGRRVPQGVNAVTRSPSILADRALELVGNYEGGSQLQPDHCIPVNRSFTPQSISQIIGSATNFVNSISPDGSTNIADALRGIDQTSEGNGKAASNLLASSSALLGNPDQTIADLGEITRNMAELTSMLRKNRDPLKDIVQDMPVTTPYIDTAIDGSVNLSAALPEATQLVGDLELKLGPEVQNALDEVSEFVRIFSPHYKFFADALNPLPRWISGLNFEPPGATAGGLAKHINNHVFDLLEWRPPLFRIPTPNGLVACGQMNSAMPGSCADIGGRPYAVDVALLQYVLTEAARR
jgi:phospholipid/cholesterol/gamma-HCH transport system substrate-binding protein